MKRTLRPHNREFQQEAVALVVEPGNSCTAAGRSFGVTRGLIGRWKDELDTHKAAAFPGQGKRTAEHQRIHELEVENCRLRLEREILKRSHGLLCQGKRMRYQCIDEQKKAWSVTLICGVLGFSRSGSYDWTRRGLTSPTHSNSDLVRRICAIFMEHRHRYGARRIAKTLQQEGFQCSENRIARRMQALNLRAIQVRKHNVTTDSKHSKPVAPDLIKQEFHAIEPNQKWTSDITYVWTDEGWLYLAVVMDLYSRAIADGR